MSSDSLVALTDILMEKEIFFCVVCKDILLPPISLVENVGNVCSECYSHRQNEENWHGIVNNSLEVVLQELRLPCKNRARGCATRHLFTNLKSHYEVCEYRTKRCPMYMCAWDGRLDFRSHFLNAHKDHVVDSADNTFQIETEFSFVDIMKLFTCKRNAYVLRMRTNIDNSKLYYILCNTKGSSPICQYSVKHKGVSDSTIKTKHNQIMSPEHIENEFDEGAAVEIDLRALNSIVRVADKLISVFKITDNSLHDDYVDRLHQFFECPVCKSLMKPPIFQCQAGHSVCNLCRPRLDRCPTCRAPFVGNTRNYSLEALTTTIRYPCIYHEYGCTETFSSSECSTHENTCQYKTVTCPAQGCGFKENHLVIREHLAESHPDILLNPIFNETGDCFYSEQYFKHGCYVFERRCLIAYGHLFRLTTKRIMDNWFWAAEIIGPRDLDRVFVYGICIADPSRKHKSLKKSDVVLNEMSDDELFKKCIMFPNNILSSYSNNGDIVSAFKIKELES